MSRMRDWASRKITNEKPIGTAARNHTIETRRPALTDPNFADVPFELDLSAWRLFTTRRVRLSWPSSTNSNYEIWAGESPASLSVLTNLPGRFPETDWMTTYSEPAQRFFRVLSSPNP